MRSMIICMAIQTGYGGVRHVAVSLPRIDFLLADWPAKYALPESLLPSAPDDPSPRRGARWTRWGHGPARHRRKQRELKELADMLGDPP